MAAHFPSPALIVMSVVSCFLTTTAFAAALTQAGWFGFFLIPSTIGFLATIPYHIYLYNYARRLVEPEPSAKGARFLPTEALVLIFVLITLWVVIFFIDILFCVGTGPGTPVGIVLSTIAAGLHWIVLAFVALKCTRESWRAEKAASSSAGAGSTPYETSDEETLTGPPPSVPRYIYLTSFILATLALVFSVSLSFFCLINVVAFFATAPYHLSVFVASGSPHRSPVSVFPHSKSVVYAFCLMALWCCVLVIDVLTDYPLFQILSATFGGLETLIVAYIAIRCVVESLSPREGPIRLPTE